MTHSITNKKPSPRLSSPPRRPSGGRWFVVGLLGLALATAAAFAVLNGTGESAPRP